VNDTPALQFLSFEASDDTDGRFTFDALASVRPGQRAALESEAAAIQAWVRSLGLSGPGPIDEGHDWDEDLLWQVEGQGDAAWHTLSLTYTGTAALADALHQLLDDGA